MVADDIDTFSSVTEIVDFVLCNLAGEERRARAVTLDSVECDIKVRQSPVCAVLYGEEKWEWLLC